jgi:hypothetical protein
MAKIYLKKSKCLNGNPAYMIDGCKDINNNNCYYRNNGCDNKPKKLKGICIIEEIIFLKVDKPCI